MSEAISWHGSTVDVQARCVPRFLWTTASIDVFLDGRCILQTGGQLKITGSHSATFTHSNLTHSTKLSWQRTGFSFSFPYELEIDSVSVAKARVHIRNWPLMLVGGVLLAGMVILVLRLIFPR
jgi:hypothetical protein